MNIKKIIRKNIDLLIPYESARSLGNQGKVFLNANELPFSFVFCNKHLNRYPECQPKILIQYYADYVNLNTNQILVTRGADEGIQLLMTAFCEPKKDCIIICPPTYGMYYVSAQIIGIKCHLINLLPNWQLNILEIMKKINNTKIIYICRPNNPTGNVFSFNDINKLLRMTKNKLLIVIDEAYIEFCKNETLVKLMEKYSHLVILRTLSKAFGLASIRCGFVLANTLIINSLLKVIAPYPISTIVTDIAIQGLSKSKLSVMKKNIFSINKNKEWLINNLKTCPLVKKVFPSKTNYILVRFLQSQAIFRFLLNKGIVLRNQNSYIDLSECLRITIGSYKECKNLLHVLNSFPMESI
ncbi:histidinol-phosphate transaminase [Candidatus Tachikawaea gelatinosa]|uniref:Histidinol-phosphate aminotransferase n=1 Tax=Candidatus Tachikawaea gelatinosa TaxID=1410383 RepID=A0A090BWJ3_9ENTR|nr:histidinol-phosphate transaminase [Candidatus Tachikawaea gelatinosa]BAP58706.1 histidinol-phosphate aminotransferase [Candidatus Tachikawaea gelatinosa]